NESAEIMRMLNTAFDSVGANENDYYPERLRAEIDQLNDEILENINTRVYKASHAEDDLAKEEVAKLYRSLDQLEERLENNHYLLGDEMTEADWRLFVTLIRFDHVYHGQFKTDQKKIVDY